MKYNVSTNTLGQSPHTRRVCSHEKKTPVQQCKKCSGQSGFTPKRSGRTGVRSWPSCKIALAPLNHPLSIVVSFVFFGVSCASESWCIPLPLLKADFRKGPHHMWLISTQLGQKVADSYMDTSRSLCLDPHPHETGLMMICTI